MGRIRNAFRNMKDALSRKEEAENQNVESITQNRSTKRAFRNVALKLPNDQTTKTIYHNGRTTVAVGSRTNDRKARMAHKAARRDRLRGI